MKGKFIIFFICLFTNLAYSQVPGYLGKRFIVSYTNSAIPAFESPMASRYGVGVCFTNVLGGEYVISASRSIGVSTHYVRTGFAYNKLAYYQDDFYYKGDPNQPGVVNNLGVALSYKFYGKKRIAPLGNYFKMEALFTRYIVKYNSEEFYYRYYPSYNSYYEERKLHAGSGIIAFNGVGVATSIGRQRVFYNRLVLDFGVRTSLMIPFIYQFETEIENRIRSNVGFRFFSHQFLNLKIGIGFLAF